MDRRPFRDGRPWRSLGDHRLILRGGNFDYTRYYEDEMGSPLFRRWATFKDLVPQDRLADIKHQALELEERWTVDKKRRLNIDPGLLTAERLVLATGKNYSHRIYLGKGIFGDLTLIFYQGSFSALGLDLS